MAFPERLKAKACEVSANTKRIAQDDPRRIIHSAKVGLALTLVSLFYYYQPLYDNFGFSAMWAVMTVVVVFEFSVGKFVKTCRKFCFGKTKKKRKRSCFNIDPFQEPRLENV